MITEKTFHTDNLSLNYAEGAPNGPAMVFLHGATVRWQDMAPLVTDLASHYHVYACDLRGHGKSGHAVSYHVADFVQDIVAFIRDCVGAPVVLAGHSLGGMVSIGVAAQIPNQIQSLILLDPPLYLREENIRYFDFVYRYFLAFYACTKKQRTVAEAFSELFPGIDDAGIRDFAEKTEQTDPLFLKTLIDDAAFTGWDVRDALEKITPPALLLYGEIEKGAVVREQDVTFFLKHTRRGNTALIKDAGHLLQLDQPGRVLELVQNFITTGAPEML